MSTSRNPAGTSGAADTSASRDAAASTAPFGVAGYVGYLKVHRGEIVAVAILGIVLGLVALFWPSGTLLTVAIVFGSYLVASGIVRITSAFIVPGLDTGMRWLTGILGLIVTIAGVLSLANPFGSLIIIAFVIGIGWIAGGIADLVAGVRHTTSPRWLAFVSGVVSILAGITMFVLPAFALQAFLFIGAMLLIAVSVATLLTLPRSPKKAAKDAAAPGAS